MICISYTQSTNGHQSQHALLNAIWIGTCGNLSIKKQTVEAAMVKVFDAKAETWQLKFEQKADYVKTMTRRLANILRAVSVGMKKHGGWCKDCRGIPQRPRQPMQSGSLVGTRSEGGSQVRILIPSSILLCGLGIKMCWG